jgi:formate dehydrogenase iron-sulfur subunit
MTGIGMLIDTSKCQACKACQVACQQWHTLVAEDTTFTGSYTNPLDMSGSNLTVVKFTEIESAGKLQWLFFKDQCRHCDSPSCKAVCPFKAIKRTSDGKVRIDKKLCKPKECSTKAIKPCQKHCPFKIPKWKYTANGKVLKKKMVKCDMCFNRMNTSPQATKLAVPPFTVTGGTSAIPACALTCPPGAITYDSISAVLTKASARVAELQAAGYSTANVYPANLPTHVKWVLVNLPEVYGLDPSY